MRLFKEVLVYKDFLREYTLQQLRGRYRGSVLGFLWTLLNPLLLLGTFSFIFSYINKTDIRTFVPLFFGAYIPWLFFANTGNSAVASVVSNASFVTRIHVPKAIFPLTAVAINIVDLVATIVIAIPVIVFLGGQLHPTLFIVPLSAIILIAFVVGIAFLFALLNVFFRDFGFIWVSVSFVWFFLTPILYPKEMLPPRVQHIMEMNPFLPFVDIFQQPIARGVIPPAETWLTACAIAALTLILGTAAYQHTQRRFYEYL